MIPNFYSRKQLEEKASELLLKFDPERQNKCKPLDVYEVIEKCLGVPYDWKYITPDQSILGLTAFVSGFIWVWPESCYKDGMKPYKMYLEEGTILIDSTLTEQENRGLENFTVMHEVFHQILHRPFFQHCSPGHMHTPTRRTRERQKRPLTLLEKCEYQANYCASAFLMPARLVEDRLKHYHVDYIMNFSKPEDRKILIKMADEFNVTKTAFKYRLMNLGYACQEYWS